MKSGDRSPCSPAKTFKALCPECLERTLDRTQSSLQDQGRRRIWAVGEEQPVWQCDGTAIRHVQEVEIDDVCCFHPHLLRERCCVLHFAQHCLGVRTQQRWEPHLDACILIVTRVSTRTTERVRCEYSAEHIDRDLTCLRFGCTNFWFWKSVVKKAIISNKNLDFR